MRTITFTPGCFARATSIFLDLFREGDDVNHFTAGVTLGAPQGVQLQFAGDFSDEGDVFVGSVIYQFGKTVLGR